MSSEIYIGEFKDNDVHDVFLNNRELFPQDSTRQNQFFINPTRSHKLDNYFTMLSKGDDELYKKVSTPKRTLFEFFTLSKFSQVEDGLKTPKIVYENKEYDVVQFCYYRPGIVLDIHGVKQKIAPLLSVPKIAENVSLIETAVRNIKEMDYWEKELSNISDGYENIYDNEAEKAHMQINDCISSLLKIITKYYRVCFFNYSHSTVQDLSVIDGIRHFEWDGGFFSSFNFRPYLIEKLYELFKDIFDDDKELCDTFVVLNSPPWGVRTAL